MTMQNTLHPDDERLAAYAGGDSDALADSSLVSHVTTCDRCRPLVDELSLLRGALAELPDLTPSRPLRLIPPVWDAATPAGRPGSWLRRLTAPAMAAGAGLVLVGAVGIGATGLAGLAGKSASLGAPEQAASASDHEFGPITGAGSPTAAPGDALGGAGNPSSVLPRTMGSSPPASPKPSADDAAGRTDSEANNSSSEQPWLTLLIAGAGLFGISTALRFSLSPRAG
jgi:anti-sigma factor RsiW